MSSYYDYLLKTLGPECPVTRADSKYEECEKEMEIVVKDDGKTVLRVGKVQRTSPIPSKW